MAKDIKKTFGNYIKPDNRDFENENDNYSLY